MVFKRTCIDVVLTFDERSVVVGLVIFVGRVGSGGSLVVDGIRVVVADTIVCFVVRIVSMMTLVVELQYRIRYEFKEYNG